MRNHTVTVNEKFISRVHTVSIVSTHDLELPKQHIRCHESTVSGSFNYTTSTRTCIRAHDWMTWLLTSRLYKLYSLTTVLANCTNAFSDYSQRVIHQFTVICSRLLTTMKFILLTLPTLQHQSHFFRFSLPHSFVFPFKRGGVIQYA